MKMLFRYVFYHNAKKLQFQRIVRKGFMESLLENYQEPFLLYADVGLERAAAAVRIQQNWRKYLVHKNAKESIFVKMKKTRAAYRIQRFWRDRIFYHRLSFQRNISYQLKIFNSPSILIPTHIYPNLPHLLQQNKQNKLYPNLSLTKPIPCPSSSHITVIWSLPKQVPSPNIRTQFFNSVIKLQQQEMELGVAGCMEGKYQQCDLWNVLHGGAEVSKVQFMGVRFYQFRFRGVEDLRYRVFLMALLSYRWYGGRYFLPLDRGSLDNLQNRLQQYQLLLSPTTPPQPLQKLPSPITPITPTLTILTKITPLGIFLSQSPHSLLNSPHIYTTKVQFYQKVYQNFPHKYQGILYYSLPIAVEMEIKEERERDIQRVIGDGVTVEEGIGRGWGVQGFMSVTKIDKRKLSYYDLGGTDFDQTKPIPKPQTQPILPQHHPTQQPSSSPIKKQMISRTKVQSITKKQEIIQRKTANLRKIRQDVQKQKSNIQTMKNIKDFQRSQEMRRKVQRVKDMKNRIKSQKKGQGHQDDFLQQGNFVMEQQLKMIVMRSKMEAMKPRSRDYTCNSQKSDTSSARKKSQKLSKSFYTEQRNKQIQVFSNHQYPTKPVVHSLGATLVNNLHLKRQESMGEDKKIINMRNQRRSKSRSIGAYLRDPSLVHGVFPEEYYPIQSKDGSGNFKFFPPLM